MKIRQAVKLKDSVNIVNIAEETHDKPTLLIVDDQPENIDVLSNILRGNYKVKAATTGEKALQIIQGKNLPDLILLDIMMPGMDGYEVCQQLKQDELTCNIPVIFVSALQNLEDRVTAFTSGGVDYLTKPVQPEEVRARVNAHVQIKLMQQKLADANTDLEHKVKERTLEVETAYNELHESFKQILDSEIKYRSLLEAAPDAVLLVNKDGKIEMSNRAAYELFRYSENELVGQSIEMLISENTDKHIELRQRYMEKPSKIDLIKNTSLRAVRKDGSIFPVEISLNPVETNEGVMVIADIRDISEREQLYSQLQQAQKMEAIGQLTGGIAHDFNNMLASILGFNQLAIEMSEDIDNEKLDEYLHEVNIAGERARDLIAQMLSFSRREGERAHLPLDLSILIKEVVSLIRPMLPSSIEMNYTSGKNIPMVKADPVKIHQVLMNMCINARDALSGHGKIDLRLARTVVDAAICSSCHQAVSGQFIEICISDNGMGIDDNSLGKIFDPFYTTKDVGKGTGMGLSVVHGILHDHQGHIILNSVQGEGTQFRLLLPLLEAEDQEK